MELRWTPQPSQHTSTTLTPPAPTTIMVPYPSLRLQDLHILADTRCKFEVHRCEYRGESKNSKRAGMHWSGNLSYWIDQAQDPAHLTFKIWDSDIIALEHILNGSNVVWEISTGIYRYHLLGGFRPKVDTILKATSSSSTNWSQHQLLYLLKDLFLNGPDARLSHSLEHLG